MAPLRERTADGISSGRFTTSKLREDPSPHTPMIFTGGFVFHFPLVKTGESMGRLRSATDFSLKADTAL